MAKILGWSPCKNAGSSGESALFYVSTSVLESSLCTTVTWLPVSDTPAVAAQLTVSDDLAAAKKKGKAAASRFPDAKIALQGRMAA